MTTTTEQLNQILLIEDNADDCEATMRSFKKANLMNPIHWSENAQDGLDYLKGEGKYGNRDKAMKPCIILLDLNMPGMDGRDALKVIKSDAELRTIPVIVLTTSSSPEDIQRCYDMGASTYINKPVEFNGLVEAAARLKDYWFGVALLPHS